MVEHLQVGRSIYKDLKNTPNLMRCPGASLSDSQAEESVVQLESFIVGRGAGHDLFHGLGCECIPLFLGVGNTLARRLACTLPGLAPTPRCSSLPRSWVSLSSSMDVPLWTKTSPGRHQPCSLGDMMMKGTHVLRLPRGSELSPP